MRADGELVGLAGVFGVLAHGGGQFLHRGGGFFQVGGLLFGAARQVVVARGDFAGGGADAARGVLDAADDLGQLGHGRVGIVAHGCEHAVELAVHACGEIAVGDGLQQVRQLRQVAVGYFHHGVEVLDHDPEVVVEAQCIAALAEVAGGRSLGQGLDLGIDRQQAGLRRVHRFMQDRAGAGQAARVLRQVAGCVLVEHVDGVLDRVQVLEDHRVHAHGQLAVHAREVFRNAVADVRAGVHFHHLLGFAGVAAQHQGHVAGGRQHTAGFVGGSAGGDVHRQVATGDRLDGLHGLADRPGHRARDHHAHRHGEQRQQHDAGDDGHHAAVVGGIGVGDLRLHQAAAEGAELLEVVEHLAARWARLLIGDLLGQYAIGGGDGRAHLGIGGEVGLEVGGDLAVEALLLLAGGQGGVGAQLVAHGLGGGIHALVVVGDLVRLVQHAQLGQFKGAELTQLRADFAQVLHGRNVVARHRGEFGVEAVQAHQGEDAQRDRHQGGEGEPDREFAADGQIMEPLHAGNSGQGRGAQPWERWAEGQGAKAAKR